MALVPFNIIPIDANIARASWRVSGTDTESWVYQNGAEVARKIVDSGTDRSIELPINIGAVAHVEVHAVAPGDDPQSTVPEPNTRPALYWHQSHGSAVDGYKVSLNGTRSSFVDHDGTQDTYNMACPQDLKEGWNTVKITAVDIYGNEGTHDTWPHKCLTPMPAPVSVSIVGNAGTFTFAITA